MYQYDQFSTSVQYTFFFLFCFLFQRSPWKTALSQSFWFHMLKRRTQESITFGSRMKKELITTLSNCWSTVSTRNWTGGYKSFLHFQASFSFFICSFFFFFFFCPFSPEQMPMMTVVGTVAICAALIVAVFLLLVHAFRTEKWCFSGE